MATTKKDKGTDAGGASSVQTETVNFDTSNLSSEQADELRVRLREIVAGIQGGAGARSAVARLARIRDSHSSHGDTDGWI